jgi:predicted DNA-binding transcriptional regulator YafY
MTTTPTGRGAPALRHLDTLRYLIRSRAPVTVAGIEDATGIHWRTVYRDLAALMRAGIPIERNKVEGTFQLKRRDFLAWLDERENKLSKPLDRSGQWVRS